MWRPSGRYLSYERGLRAGKVVFVEPGHDCAAAAEVTLHPLGRFAFCGSILFSDILVIPHALGQERSFGPGEGPRLSPPLLDGAVEGLRVHPERLRPIIETVRQVAARSDRKSTRLNSSH